MSKKKSITIVILGNIIEYYDFLLFAHLGPIITPLFFTSLSAESNHLLSLLLFGTSFIVRPIGGYIFGRISDLRGRKEALTTSMKWAVIPALIFGFLPTTETIGITAAIIFVLARLMQGIALGGEYTTAGTYLMETNSKNLGVISGVLVASGTLGSLIAFYFSFLCLHENAPYGLWRIFFFIGGMGSIVTFFIRRYLDETHKPELSPKKEKMEKSHQKLLLVFLIGLIVGTTTWVPMVYSNYYLTKVLGLPNQIGLIATLTALIGYLFLNPLFGLIFDRWLQDKYMKYVPIILIPTTFVGFYLVLKNFIILGQILLVIGASAFGAPIHVLMNKVFKKFERSRRINLFFSIGLSFGGITPSLSGFLLDRLNIRFFPAIWVSIFSVIFFFVFKKIHLRYKKIVISS